MTETALIKINQPYAFAVCQGIELDEQATALLQDNPTTADFIQQLIEQRLYPDAVRFLAPHCLSGDLVGLFVRP